MKLLAATMFVLFAFVFSASAQTNWVGFYEFYEDGGKTAGGSKIFVAHDLEVFETDDGLKARIKANGFQTSRDINAAAKVEGAKISFYLEGYGEDNVLELYEPDELLFSLEIKNKKMVTNWNSYKPALAEKPVSGKEMFKKQTVTTN